MIYKGWVDRATGAIRIFGENEELEDFSAETHDLVDVPQGVIDGVLDWDAETRSFLAPVPVSVTPRQMRLALIQQGLGDEVEAYVATLDKAALVEWEYATEVMRDNGLIAAAQAGLGMSDAQVDDLFRLASTL